MKKIMIELKRNLKSIKLERNLFLTFYFFFDVLLKKKKNTWEETFGPPYSYE